VLLAAVGVLCVADAVWLAAPEEPRHSTAFARAVSSLGLGSAVSGAWSHFGFDPRLESRCENELAPIPGLACPNPYHGAALVDLPPLPRTRE
jgi:hypothetical protein